MSDYHLTVGFARDKTEFFRLLNRIASALERIATEMEAGEPIEPKWPTPPHRAAGFTDEEWSDHLDGK